MNRRERRSAAKKSRISLGISSPAALCEAGLNHLQAGRLLDAQLCCQQALAIDPNFADAFHLMGLLSFQARQHDHAVEWIARAIRQDPKPDYLVRLGTALRRLGKLEDALKAFDKAVQLKPDASESWKHLANVLVDLNRPDQAVLGFQRALELSSRNWGAADKLGALLLQLGRLEEALSCFDWCDQIRPDRASTLQKRAVTKFGLDRLEDALADIRRAQALDPTNADNCNNIGAILQRMGRDAEALPWFDIALGLRPNYPSAFTNKASSLTQLHRFTEAFAVYREMKALDPADAEADWNIALLHLLAGNFEAGWAGREVRWKLPNLPIGRIASSQPVWLGRESVESKTILIHADEGLGDTIQFARYVPMVAARGARVILVIQKALHPLLAELPGVSECIPMVKGDLPAFDMYCPLSSLPLAFGTTLQTIPVAQSYLPTAPAACLRAWEDRLGPRDRLRIGLVWSGNPKHKNDHNRSLPLRDLSPLLDLDATFISLQKEPRPDDKATLLERTGIVDLTEHLTDFVETAALVSGLDLVITVDTSVAHLAGALGCPTWILLPYTPDYRWLLDRDDSPWYPTVRLFRQTASRDYATVIERVRAELTAQIALWPNKQNASLPGTI